MLKLMFLLRMSNHFNNVTVLLGLLYILLTFPLPFNLRKYLYIFLCFWQAATPPALTASLIIDKQEIK